MRQRRRSRGKVEPEDDDEEAVVTANSVVFISSSDDDEANRDLTLEILERAKKRRKASEELKRVLDLSGDEDEKHPAEAKQGRKHRGKKKSVKGKPQLVPEIPDKEGEPPGTAGSVVTELNDMTDVVGGTKISNNGTFDALALEEGTLEKADLVVSNDATNNVVLRKLLRGPRYFDPGDQTWGSCYNCGEEGHQAVNCTKEKRQKPCFICGLFGHSSKHCSQGQDCFICKRRGHLAKDCPEKNHRTTHDSKLCLRCGYSGHDMSVCKNEYAPDDLKEVQCYVCQKFGHLCCANLMDRGSGVIACYNCAQFGHSGLGCAKPRGETYNDITPTLCYKCGEEGHFARGCTKKTKSARSVGTSFTKRQQFDFDESSSHRSKFKRSKERGLKSAPNHFETRNRNISPQYGRSSKTGFAKSKIRGGWIVDDPGDSWESPRFSAYEKSTKYHHSTSSKNHPSSPRKYKSPKTSYTHNNSYKPAIAASRFDSSYSRR